MNCVNHPNKEATGVCTYCGKFFCDECLVDIEGKNYCKEHITNAFKEQSKNNQTPNINIVNNNEHTIAATATATSINANRGITCSAKNKNVALILCLLGFLGLGGFHKFYVGKIGMGILYLFTVGLFGIGTIIDLIKIISGTFTDVFGLPLK